MEFQLQVIQIHYVSDFSKNLSKDTPSFQKWNWLKSEGDNETE